VYPTCCLDYHKFPESFYKENPGYATRTVAGGYIREMCIACINKKEMVEIKPAKK